MSRSPKPSQGEALAPVLACRGDRREIERLRRVLLYGAAEPDLADELAAKLADGATSCDALASALKRRRCDVLRALRRDPRFAQRGRGRHSRWHLAKTLARGDQPVPIRPDGPNVDAGEAS